MKRMLLTTTLLAGLAIGGMSFASLPSAEAAHVWETRPVPHDDSFRFRIGKFKFSLGGGPRYYYAPAPYYVERPVYVERPWYYDDRPVLIERRGERPAIYYY